MKITMFSLGWYLSVGNYNFQFNKYFTLKKALVNLHDYALHPNNNPTINTVFLKSQSRCHTITF